MPRLRNADGRHLVERHLRAIGIDHHRIEHVRRGPAGAQTRQFGLERGDGALHAALDLVDIVHFVCHGDLPELDVASRSGSR